MLSSARWTGKTVNKAQKGKNRYRFQSFTERLDEIDINVTQRLHDEGKFERPRNEETLGVHASLFTDKLMQVIQENKTSDFSVIYCKLKPLSKSLPLVILHAKEIIDFLLQGLDSEYSILPCLDLIAFLIRDLRHEIVEEHTRIVPRLTEVLLQNLAFPNIIRGIFECFAYMFKFWQRYLSKDYVSVVLTMRKLLFHDKFFLRKFSAESLGFLLRRVNGKDLLTTVERLLDALQPTPDADATSLIEGTASLVYQCIKNVQDTFHSCTEQVMTALFDALSKGGKTKSSFRVSLLNRLFWVSMSHCGQNPLPAAIWDPLLHFAHVKHDSEVMASFDGFECSLLLMKTTLSYRNGQCVPDIKEIKKLMCIFLDSSSTIADEGHTIFVDVLVLLSHHCDVLSLAFKWIDTVKELPSFYLLPRFLSDACFDADSCMNILHHVKLAGTMPSLRVLAYSLPAVSTKLNDSGPYTFIHCVDAEYPIILDELTETDAFVPMSALVPFMEQSSGVKQHCRLGVEKLLRENSFEQLDTVLQHIQRASSCFDLDFLRVFAAHMQDKLIESDAASMEHLLGAMLHLVQLSHEVNFKLIQHVDATHRLLMDDSIVVRDRILQLLSFEMPDSQVISMMKSFGGFNKDTELQVEREKVRGILQIEQCILEKLTNEEESLLVLHFLIGSLKVPFKNYWPHLVQCLSHYAAAYQTRFSSVVYPTMRQYLSHYQEHNTGARHMLLQLLHVHNHATFPRAVLHNHLDDITCDAVFDTITQTVSGPLMCPYLTVLSKVKHLPDTLATKLARITELPHLEESRQLLTVQCLVLTPMYSMLAPFLSFFEDLLRQTPSSIDVDTSLKETPRFAELVSRIILSRLMYPSRKFGKQRTPTIVYLAGVFTSDEERIALFTRLSTVMERASSPKLSSSLVDTISDMAKTGKTLLDHTEILQQLAIWTCRLIQEGNIVRGSACSCLALLMNGFPNQKWDMKSILQVCSPMTDKLYIEHTQDASSGIWNLIVCWTSHVDFLRVLLEAQSDLFLSIASVIRAPSLSSSVLAVVFDLFTRVISLCQNEMETKQELNILLSVVLSPLLDAMLLRHTNETKAIISSEEVQFLQEIGPLFLMSSMHEHLISQLDAFAKLVAQILVQKAKRLSKGSDKAKQEYSILLTLLRDISKALRHHEGHAWTIESHRWVETTFSLLSVLSETNHRSVLGEYFTIVLKSSTHSPSSLDVGVTLGDLNSFEASRIGFEYDFDRRFNALERIQHISIQDFEQKWTYLVPLLHTLSFDVSISDLGLRRGTVSALEHLFVLFASNSGMVRFVQDTAIPRILESAHGSNESIRRDAVLFLRSLSLKQCLDIPLLHDLTRLKLAQDDKAVEEDFLQSMVHVQIHTRRKALLYLCKQELDSSWVPVMRKVLLPFVEGILYPDSVRDQDVRNLPQQLIRERQLHSYNRRHALLEDTLRALAVLVTALPWMDYKHLVQRLLRNTSPATLRTHVLADSWIRIQVRALCLVLGGFHYTCTAEIEAMILDKVAPQLLEHAGLSKSTTKALAISKADRIRFAVASGYVKILLQLPGGVNGKAKTGIMLLFRQLARLSRHKEQEVRDQARKIVCTLVGLIGVGALPLLLTELNHELKSDKQVCVRAYILSAALQIVIEAPNFQSGSLDSNALALLQVFIDDLYGDTAGHRKDLKEDNTPIVKMKEMNTGKSLSSIQLLCGIVSFEAMAPQMMEAVDATLYQCRSKASLSTSRQVYSKCIAGFKGNSIAATSDLFVFGHMYVEKAMQSRVLKKQKTEEQETLRQEAKQHKLSAQDRMAVEHLPKKTKVSLAIDDVSAGEWTGINDKTKYQSIQTEFGLGLILATMKQRQHDCTHTLPVSMFDPLIPILLNAITLYGTPECMTTALQILGMILKLPDKDPGLPHLLSLSKKFLRIMIDQSTKSHHTELTKACFHTLSIFVRESKTLSLSKAQVEFLLGLIQKTIADTSKHATVFPLLKAIVARKLQTPTISSVMADVQRLSIQSSVDHIRKTASQVMLGYLLDFPMKKAEREQHIAFYQTNLSYEYHTGRASALSMIEAMAIRFPEELLSTYCSILAYPILLRIGAEADLETRQSLGKVLFLMLRAVREDARKPVLDAVQSWMKPKMSTEKTLQKTKIAAIALESCQELLSEERHRVIAEGCEALLTESHTLLKEFLATVSNDRSTLQRICIALPAVLSYINTTGIAVASADVLQELILFPHADVRSGIAKLLMRSPLQDVTGSFPQHLLSLHSSLPREQWQSLSLALLQNEDQASTYIRALGHVGRTGETEERHRVVETLLRFMETAPALGEDDIRTMMIVAYKVTQDGDVMTAEKAALKEEGARLLSKIESLDPASFPIAYNSVRKEVEGMKESRKRQRSEAVVSHPELAAKRKTRQNEKKKEQRKRKNTFNKNVRTGHARSVAESQKKARK